MDAARAQASPSERALADEADEAGCGAMRAELCRLAAGASLLGEGGLALARHVRACGGCDAYADELGRVCGWLAEAGGLLDRLPGERELVARSRQALVRELHARLARDLLAVGQGRAPRALEALDADLQRLEVLGRHEPRAVPAPVRRWVSTGRPPRRVAALALAARLDPLGLDVALAWMGALVRQGRDEEAHRLADRLLAAAGADDL